MEQQFKRNVAYKYRIGSILNGKQVAEGEKLKHIEIDNKNVVRVNVIANVIDKYIQDGEKKFASLTLDDGSGQLKMKVFGEDIHQFEQLNQGDTIQVIGLMRSWKDELYITPESIKKKEPGFLLVRKIEVEKNLPKALPREQIAALKDKMLSMIKDAEKDSGIETEKLITELKEPPEAINNEIKKLLEEGMIYEPRPGKLRYLG
ncbi:MAG TPA: OB-fold nucleic acid binding domain-containing protein [Candidatus Nanoarchaeia archaeon]|nr:OB-fold nucleic acid binding domain-containing protein [Candidatus Nanoarchaeia archaeon]